MSKGPLFEGAAAFYFSPNPQIIDLLFSRRNTRKVTHGGVRELKSSQGSARSFERAWEKRGEQDDNPSETKSLKATFPAYQKLSPINIV